MAGTGYAAFKLPKNSVGTKQIKKNAVTGAKVKKQTLTGSDINLKKLGTVPTASVAEGLSALEPVHLVGAPGEPPFLGGSSTFTGEAGLSFGSVGFYKDHEGIVHLEGVVKTGKESLVESITPIFTLPPGFRPASGVTQLFGGLGSNTALIFGSGTSLTGKALDGMVAGTKEQAVILDGVTFRAAS
jgi:hypothetical protein